MIAARVGDRWMRIDSVYQTFEVRYELRLRGLASAEVYAGESWDAMTPTGKSILTSPLSVEFHRWRIAYGTHRGVQLCLRDGLFTIEALREELVDDELASGLPFELWEMDVAHSGAFTHKHGTGNGYVLLPHVKPEHYPHPGPPPPYNNEDL